MDITFCPNTPYFSNEGDGIRRRDKHSQMTFFFRFFFSLIILIPTYSTIIILNNSPEKPPILKIYLSRDKFTKYETTPDPPTIRNDQYSRDSHLMILIIR